MERKKDAYCGLFCGACSIFLATENGTIEKLAKEMKLTVEKAKCYGCKSDKNPPFCRDCVLKVCARKKEFDFCIECSEYPCKDLNDFVYDKECPYHLPTPKYLERIKEAGINTWLKEQEERWKCSNCNTKFQWKAESCENCGKAVPDYKADL